MLNIDVHPRSHPRPQISHVSGSPVAQDMIPLDHTKQLSFEVSVTDHLRPRLITHDCPCGHQHSGTRPVGAFVEHFLSGAHHRRRGECEITSYLILIQQDGERAVIYSAMLIGPDQGEVQLSSDVVDQLGGLILTVF